MKARTEKANATAPNSRRNFLKQTAVGVSLAPLLHSEDATATAQSTRQTRSMANMVAVRLRINNTNHNLNLDPRTTILDLLREQQHLTGTKKGCNHGQCGACTVLVDGRRINSCLALAVVYDGSEITTIEGLAQGEELHPVQAAFIKHDGFQCGYCTSGQICSAVAMLREVEQGTASQVSTDVRQTKIELTDDEIRERMSGNICRCGAYPGIVAAIKEVKNGKEARR
ncbi:MAG: 2Fe-2S iron-sulfur cluster-binding protein [Blastocatellia bacterium]